MGCASSKPASAPDADADATSTVADEAPIYFVRESVLQQLNRLPRRASSSIAASSSSDANVQEPLVAFDKSKTCFVFISHRWLQPGSVETAHPDTDANDKCRLILAALHTLRGENAPVPAGVDFAIWVDFSCIDQDGDPAAEMNARMEQIIRKCDLVLTPVVDPEHRSWDYPRPLPPGGWLDAYQAVAWLEYWKRAWCRIEAMLCAACPVDDSASRAALFRGAMSHAISAGRRPHAIYGDKEAAKMRPPRVLSPLLHGTFARFPPEEGELTNSSDLPIIRALSSRARDMWPEMVVGYVHGPGFEYVGGSGSGHGKHVYADGAEYVGAWRDEKKHGHGRALYADGSIYEGQWADGKKHGVGKISHPSGDYYEGGYCDDKKHGRGTAVRVRGDVYEGEFALGKKHGVGTLTSPRGTCYAGQWREGKRHGKGSLTLGGSAESHETYWVDDRRDHWHDLRVGWMHALHLAVSSSGPRVEEEEGLGGAGATTTSTSAAAAGAAAGAAATSGGHDADEDDKSDAEPGDESFIMQADRPARRSRAEGELSDGLEA